MRKIPAAPTLAKTMQTNVVPVNTDTCSSAQALCKTGVFAGGVCDPDVQYHVPSGGEGSFYTTWSFYLCIVGVFFLCCYLAATLVARSASGSSARIRNFKEQVLENPVFQLVAIALIAMPFLNSIGVLFTSQMLLAKNFKLNQTDPKDAACPKLLNEPKSISTSFFDRSMNINLLFHITPAIIAIAGLLLLSLNRTGRTLFKGQERKGGRGWKWNLGLGALIFAYNLIFIVECNCS